MEELEGTISPNECMSLQSSKLGLVAVLAYGLFDAVTYTTFFVLAFLVYEKSTGNNPAANIQALLGWAYSCLAYMRKQRCFMKDTSQR